MKSSQWIGGLLFIIIGALLFFYGINLGISGNEFMKTALSTTGRITDIQVYRKNSNYRESYDYYYENDYNRRRDDLEYDVYMEYEVEGKIYDGKCGYSTGMKEGDRITVYYAPNNHADYMVEGQNVANWFVPVIGLVFLLIGLSMIISNLNKSSVKRYVLNNGQMVTAEITDIYLNTSYSVNGRHPFVITCDWKNPSTGSVHEFKSENLWFNPKKVLEDEKNINVFIDPINPKRYYVDTRSLDKKIVN